MAATGSRGRGSDSKGEERDGVALTNLDQELFTGAGVTKRELVDYLDAMAPRLLPALAGRPLSVVRALRGQKPFMQKNVPKYAPDFVRTVSFWAESSHREVAYALCDDRPTLLWFANQRAIEYHPTLTRADAMGTPEHLVLDLDPPEDAGFDAVVAAAHLVRRALDDVGLAGVVKTTGPRACTSSCRWRPGRPTRTSRAPPARSRCAPSGSTRRSRPRRSSAPTAAARCSSTPPAPAARRSPPSTARACAPACRCRSR